MVLAGNAARSYLYIERVVIERYQSHQGYIHAPIRQYILLTEKLKYLDSIKFTSVHGQLQNVVFSTVSNSFVCRSDNKL